jgi:hypothetical protein
MRNLDSIEHDSSFGGFGKQSSDDDQETRRLFHLIESLFPNSKMFRSKRSFDRIAHMTTFGGFGN